MECPYTCAQAFKSLWAERVPAMYSFQYASIFEFTRIEEAFWCRTTRWSDITLIVMLINFDSSYNRSLSWYMPRLPLLRRFSRACHDSASLFVLILVLKHDHEVGGHILLSIHVARMYATSWTSCGNLATCSSLANCGSMSQAGRNGNANSLRQ